MAKGKTVDPAKELAERLFAELSRRREARENYQTTVGELGRAVDKDVAESALLAAIAKPAFKSKCVFAIAGDLSLPCATKEDSEKLASDDRVLRAICERHCSSDNPLIDLKKASALLTPALRKPFIAAWEARLETGDLPGFVGAVTPPSIGDKRGKKGAPPQFHDPRYPLPWLSVSQAIVRSIEEHRAKGDAFCDWKSVANPCARGEQAKWLAAARNSEPCLSRIVPVFAKEPDGWVVLAEDVHVCAQDPRVVDRVYSTVRKGADTAVDLANLAKQKILEPRVGNAFATLLDRWSNSGPVPAPYGLVRLGAKRLLVRLSDLPNWAVSSQPTTGGARPAERDLPAGSSQPPHSKTASNRFASEFEDAFAKLDLESGNRNFVKLLDLRRSLPTYSRQEFDGGLRELRLAMKYALEGSEGNWVTLSEEEAQAGIREAGMNLVYCRRRRM